MEVRIDSFGVSGSLFRQILENHQTVPFDVAEHFDIVPKHSVPLWKQCVSYIKNFMGMNVLKVYQNRLQTEGIGEEA
ncbi:membrane metallo-endopeptidase-like 1, partial [Caerostris extrusa]